MFGIALVWLIVGEVPRPEVLAGGTLVIGALLANELLGWRAARRRPPAAQESDVAPLGPA